MQNWNIKYAEICIARKCYCAVKHRQKVWLQNAIETATIKSSTWAFVTIICPKIWLMYFIYRAEICVTVHLL
jgi:hypothetical protein